MFKNKNLAKMLSEYNDNYESEFHKNITRSTLKDPLFY